MVFGKWVEWALMALWAVLGWGALERSGTHRSGEVGIEGEELLEVDHPGGEA